MNWHLLDWACILLTLPGVGYTGRFLLILCAERDGQRDEVDRRIVANEARRMAYLTALSLGFLLSNGAFVFFQPVLREGNDRLMFECRNVATVAFSLLVMLKTRGDLKFREDFKRDPRNAPLPHPVSLLEQLRVKDAIIAKVRVEKHQWRGAAGTYALWLLSLQGLLNKCECPAKEEAEREGLLRKPDMKLITTAEPIDPA